MSDEVASLLSLSFIAGDWVDPGYFVFLLPRISIDPIFWGRIVIRVPPGTRSRVLFAGGSCRYHLRHENSPTVRMQWRAKFISSDLDVFQFNGPFFNRPLLSLRQWCSYCTNIIDLVLTYKLKKCWWDKIFNSYQLILHLVDLNTKSKHTNYFASSVLSQK